MCRCILLAWRSDSIIYSKMFANTRVDYQNAIHEQPKVPYAPVSCTRLAIWASAVLKSLGAVLPSEQVGGKAAITKAKRNKMFDEQPQASGASGKVNVNGDVPHSISAPGDIGYAKTALNREAWEVAD